MSNSEDDHDLVARAINGDANAFGDLYELHLDDIYRYIYFRVSDHQEAEDLTERVFLKAWKSIPRYRQENVPFRAWIYRIAHNTVIDYFRTRKESLPLNDISFTLQGSVDPEAHLLSQEEVQRLERAIVELSPSEQSVLILRFINGFGTTEVADVLNRSVGAVRVLQHRALKAIQELLMTRENPNV